MVGLDMSDDRYGILAAMPRDEAQLLSETVVELMRRGLGNDSDLVPVPAGVVRT